MNKLLDFLSYTLFMAETSESEKDTQKESADKPKQSSLKKWLKIAGIGLATLVLIFGLYAGYIFAASPEVIRNPKLEHLHFRMQILVDGKAEYFGEDKYQQDYAKDQCNAELPEEPIHFHDKKDQFTHIHWDKITGGMVMKYYGWNYIGGISNALGYKLDDLGNIQKVNTHGNFLPEVPEDAEFYIYTGDENGYKEKNFDDWVKQDLETFFNTKSNFPEPTSFLDKLFPKAYAHNGEVHSDETANEEELKSINNLIGNVVIFVQKEKPTDEQIKARFSNLVPLSKSTCAG